MRKQVKAIKDKTSKERKELIANLVPMVKNIIESKVEQLKQQKAGTPEFKKAFQEVVKMVKETSRKEYQFDWADEILNDLEILVKEQKALLGRVNDARTEVNMDRKDYVEPVSTNLDDNTAGYFDGYGWYYATAVVIVAAGAAMYYRKKYIKR